MQIRTLSPGVFLAEDLLSPKECEEQIQFAEDERFADAPVTTPRGFVHMPEIRNNSRVMIDRVEVAREIFLRLEPHVPEEWRSLNLPFLSKEPWLLKGLNERWRYYRYDPGQYFKPHKDGAFHRNSHEQSFLTMLLFLNSDFEGGQTNIYPPGHDNLEVIPRAGSALFFAHRLLHEGSEVTEGTKYIMRSDVMYSNKVA